jgi:hypothetical protein
MTRIVAGLLSWTAICTAIGVAGWMREATTHMDDTAVPSAVASPLQSSGGWSDALADSVLDLNPFGSAEAPISMSDPARAMNIPRAPQSSPTVRTMRLLALAGPPWRAIIAIEGGEREVRALERGDSLPGARTLSISRDTLTIRMGNRTRRLILGESWTH